MNVRMKLMYVSLSLKFFERFQSPFDAFFTLKAEPTVLYNVWLFHYCPKLLLSVLGLTFKHPIVSHYTDLVPLCGLTLKKRFNNPGSKQR